MNAKSKPVSNRAVGYLRVSTDKQELSPTAQRHAIEEYARAQGLEIVAWCSDLGVSGTVGLEGRPGLTQALAAVATLKAGALIVAKRDRLARDSFVAMAVERALAKVRARVHSADGQANGDSATDALLRGMLDAIAAFEHAQIVGRVKAAREVMRQRKSYAGGDAQFGFRREGAFMVADYTEQRTVSRARELAAAGMSQRAIVTALATEGHTNRAGRAHTRNAIVRMLEAA